MALFTPLQLGDIQLSHRVIMAPLTRFRAKNHIPGSIMGEYYGQRTTAGGLIISETTCISDRGGMAPHMPRIDTEEAVAGWKEVVKAVHAKDGFIFCQLNHLGRAFVPEAISSTEQVYSSSDIPISGEGKGFKYSKPKAMDLEDMKNAISDFVNGADNAINKCGFDGIELHGANGYLLDQFIRDNINVRTDEFGGSIENRCKFPLMVLDAVIEKIGSKKVGYRISPWDIFQDADDSQPEVHFAYFCEQLEKRNLAYVHVVEARSDANGGRENDGAKTENIDEELLKSSAGLLKPKLPTTPLLSAGGWNSDNSELEGLNVDALVYGRYFISNPDLPRRLKEKLPLTKYDRSTFYAALDPVGYIDYPFYK